MEKFFFKSLTLCRKADANLYQWFFFLPRKPQICSLLMLLLLKKIVVTNYLVFNSCLLIILCHITLGISFITSFTVCNDRSRNVSLKKMIFKKDLKKIWERYLGRECSRQGKKSVTGSWGGNMLVSFEKWPKKT